MYDLVLIHMEKGRGQRYKFCDDVRSAMPRLALLVGHLISCPFAQMRTTRLRWTAPTTYWSAA